jgi:hypothetical protein
MIRKADGQLYCPNDADGRDAVTLTELNAQGFHGFPELPARDGGNLTKPPAETITNVADVIGRVTFGKGDGN